MNQKKIIFIVGPTAVGKTDVGALLAKKLKSKIISCDAMQVYKEISTITNKPAPAVLKSVPHRLINFVPVSKDFNVSIFLQKAVKEIRKIHRKKKIPVVVGGSGFYMSALLDGLFKGAHKNEKMRRKLEQEALKKGNDYVFRKLQSVDPAAASKIHPNNVRRVIRALEVFLTRKAPISELQKNRRGLWGQYDIRIFCLNRERQELYGIINRRVDNMFNNGAVEEIRKLSRRKWGKTALGVIGVHEIRDLLAGKRNLEETKSLIKLKTRRYAKRQLTWFRRDKRLKWVLLSGKESSCSIANQILKEIEN